MRGSISQLGLIFRVTVIIVCEIEEEGKYIIDPLTKVVMKEGPSSYQQMEALSVARAYATSSHSGNFGPSENFA